MQAREKVRLGTIGSINRLWGLGGGLGVADVIEFGTPEHGFGVGVVLELQQVTRRVFQKERPVCGRLAEKADARGMGKAQVVRLGACGNVGPSGLGEKHHAEVTRVDTGLWWRRLGDEIGDELVSGEVENQRPL